MATTLSFLLVTVLCLKAPLSVIDSREFWHAWAAKSPALARAHAGIDLWFEQNRESLRLPVGDPQAVAEAMDATRGSLHDMLSAHAIETSIGVVTGREGAVDLNSSLASLKSAAASRFAQSFGTRHCSAESAGCADGALQAGMFAMTSQVFSGALDSMAPLSAEAMLDWLPLVGSSRLAFQSMRVALMAAPVLLGLLAALVLVLSLRLRTAAFMFGCCCCFAGAALLMAAEGTQWLATQAGVSGETWQLVLASSSSSYAGLGVDSLLLVVGGVLLVARAFGPSWREAFWKKRLSSPSVHVSERAARMLARPAGLLEPWHVLTSRRQ
jgi:hypothetical protein